jgi:hypothetical protein
MNEYIVLSGDAYKVKASSEKEALKKAAAFFMAEDCPCGDVYCSSCVQYSETRTEVLP